MYRLRPASSFLRRHASSLTLLCNTDPIDDSLKDFGDIAHPDHTSVIHRTKTLDKCFCHETVEEIIDALETEAGKTQDPWCVSTLKKLEEASPLSLKVALRSWDPPSLELVTKDMVDEYFAPISALEPDLELQTEQREAFV